jgi:hypothetical protein
MESKTLMVIGLIGGILAAVGVFLEWVSVSIGVYTASASGWDMATAAVGSVSYPYVIVVGGIIALVGALGALGTQSKGIGYLLPLGGLVALGGWGWAASDVADWSAVSYGFYVCLVGAILALVGSLSLRGK